VLIDAGKIGFIDFDDFCMAEPAMDVGRFCASITDSGMQVADEQALDPAQRQEMLARLDTLKQDFVSAYAALAPISRERVALWEARDYLRDALHGWVKAKPAGPQNALLMAERHLGGMGVLA
jgi:Ser/Thr protein kinase RdoA (MazF antagonist)